MTEPGILCTVLEVNVSLPVTSVSGSHKILAELLRRDGDVQNFFQLAISKEALTYL
jgi:hypothetical protein